ncbi:hypothetical protein GCM10023196_099860 [Actinoallomurus vinaceus]|uniref:Subtilisin inhibitor domain-containing protein n=1 Tax=Actinoallomurus vinaceus TaxID=1080074 RepID=A0ABP8USQ1_9ACTN
MRGIVTALGALPIIGLLTLAAPAANGTPAIDGQQHANPHPVQPAAAQVRQDLPAYTCDTVERIRGTDGYAGLGRCTTSDNLPQQGRITVSFIIRARQGYPSAVSCSVASIFRGYAYLPEAVEGEYCR